MYLVGIKILNYGVQRTALSKQTFSIKYDESNRRAFALCARATARIRGEMRGTRERARSDDPMFYILLFLPAPQLGSES